MNINHLSTEILNRTGVGRVVQMVLAVSLLTNVLLAAGFATMDKSTRTVFLPPQITKSFWVDGNTIGAEYLEQMGQFIIQQYANVTPATVDAQNAQILKYVSPSVNSALSNRFQQSAQKLKQDNISRVFWPRDVRIDQANKKVAYIGTLDTWVADKKIEPSYVKAYLVSFEYINGFVTVKELRETDEKDPFAAPADTHN